MRRVKLFSWLVPSAAVLAVTVLHPASALAVDQPAAAADLGCGVIVMREGNLFLAGHSYLDPCPSSQRDWVLLANVFQSAGRGVPPVVGMNQHGHVLAGNGDWFQLSVDYNYCSSVSASFRSNVFDVTGVRAPGEEFMTFGGSSPGGGYAYAVTTYGNVFRWSGCVGWEYLGPLVTGGPTNSSRTSWGKLKTIYR